MKTTVVKAWLVIAIAVFGVLSPLSAAFVTVTNPSINLKLLDRVENNGVGVITFGMVETSNAVAPTKDLFGEANIHISLKMNKVRLTGDDVANITGTLMDYFSASYDAVDNRIIFSQIADFPGYGDVSVSIPVDVTDNAGSTDNSLNGFNANISANDVHTVADGSAAEFTIY